MKRRIHHPATKFMHRLFGAPFRHASSGRAVTMWMMMGLFALNILASAALPGTTPGKTAAPLSAAEPVEVSGFSFEAADLSFLCTPYGPQPVQSTEDGIPIPSEGMDGEFCFFCLPFSKSVVCAPEAQQPTAERNLSITRLWTPLDGDFAASSISAAPAQPRAPPFISA